LFKNDFYPSDNFLARTFFAQDIFSASILPGQIKI
jgi:hypothetical protein